MEFSVCVSFIQQRSSYKLLAFNSLPTINGSGAHLRAFSGEVYFKFASHHRLQPYVCGWKSRERTWTSAVRLEQVCLAQLTANS